MIVDSDHLVKSICFSKRTEERTTGVKVLNSNKICVLNNHGSLLEIVSDSDMAKTRESSKPAIKLSRKNMKTPVGGLLSALITPNETDSKEQMKEKIKINNQKLSDLLYLPGKYFLKSNTSQIDIKLFFCNSLIDPCDQKIKMEDRTSSEKQFRNCWNVFSVPLTTWTDLGTVF